jgi:hypothetical protein
MDIIIGLVVWTIFIGSIAFSVWILLFGSVDEEFSLDYYKRRQRTKDKEKQDDK